MQRPQVDHGPELLSWLAQRTSADLWNTTGFHMHLVKPIDPLELVVAVATLAPRRLGT
jgi:hypothetical protein